MKTTTFDGITRNLGGSMTHCHALRGLFAGAVAAGAGGAVLQADDTTPFCAIGHYFGLTSQSSETGAGICQRALDEI